VTTRSVSRPPRRVGEVTRRIRWAFWVSVVLVAAALAKVVWLQVTDAETLRKEGLKQRTQATKLLPTRGTIYDRNGVELAISVPATSIVADGALVTDPVATVGAVAALLSLSPERQAELVALLSDPTNRFVYIQRLLDDDTAAAVLALDLDGVFGEREDKRIIPSGEVARAIIGRTDPWGVGVGGFEEQFDAALTGTAGERVLERDIDGNSIIGGGTTTRAAIPGDDLVLTLDRSLQYQVEQALLARVVELQATGGTVVVMDVASGDVYAVANVRINDAGVPEVSTANYAAVEPNEPGSVAKVFSTAAALDMGVTTVDTYIEVPGSMIFNEGTQWQQPISDAYPHETEPMSTRDIFVRSSNIGTLLNARLVGADALETYMRAFGLGTPTAIGFDGESAGALKPASEWQGSEADTISYGYGFSATSLQLAAAVNVIANGGVYVSPRLVSHTIGPDGERQPVETPATRQVIQPSTAATMTDLMVDVVCNGTATRAQMEGMSVAGKTGTSLLKRDNDTYRNEDGSKAYYASFVGFLPANDPRVTILVSIDQPSTEKDYYGGSAAAPLFTTVAAAAIHELRITPTPGDIGCPPA
jgi:cell division protein FtsI (penicillin-binding protein 3)